MAVFLPYVTRTVSDWVFFDSRQGGGCGAGSFSTYLPAPQKSDRCCASVCITQVKKIQQRVAIVGS